MSVPVPVLVLVLVLVLTVVLALEERFSSGTGRAYEKHLRVDDGRMFRKRSYGSEDWVCVGLIANNGADWLIGFGFGRMLLMSENWLIFSFIYSLSGSGSVI